MLQSKEMLLQEIKSKVLSIATTTAALQDGDKHQFVIAAAENTSPTYLELANQLRKVRDANRRDDIYTSYIYTMYTRPDSLRHVRFSIDAEENPDLVSKPGEVYKEYDGPQDLSNLEVSDKNEKDRWGEWVTAAAPIFNSKGEFVSQVSLDVKASDVTARTNQLLLYGVMSFMFSTIIALLLTHFFAKNLSSPVSKIVAMVQSIANGKLDSRISIPELKSTNEFVTIGLELNIMGDKLQERKVMEDALFKFVSPSVAQQVLNAGGLANLNPVRKKVTVLFSDMRNFSTYSETIDPEIMFNQLNEYFEKMVDIIYAHQGTVAKFTGDGLMAIFGAPIDDAYQEKNAVEVAVEMQETISNMREKWEQEGKVPMKIGIGIANGIAMVGNYGSSLRREYTAIGDSVNLASRIESATKELHVDILITGYVYEAVAGLFQIENKGLISVKGRSQQVSVYSVKYKKAKATFNPMKLVA